MKLNLAIRLGISVAAISATTAQTDKHAIQTVTAVRHWSLAGATRVAVEVSGEFEFVTDRLHNPERVYYDILNARPRIDSRRLEIDDKLVKRIRVAETVPGVTRIVLDLGDNVEAITTQLSNPDRLVIELRGPVLSTPTSAPTGLPNPPVIKKPEPLRPDLPVPLKQPLKAPLRAQTAPPIADPPKPDRLAERVPDPSKSVAAALETPKTASPAAEPPKVLAAAPERPSLPPALPVEPGKAARRTANGETSLVRALGLKLNRVVIDPGHGGHDHGCEGAKGVMEKDLVLDVAKRVGKLIEERLNAEVIYTRSDDTFIPLEGRTALANEKKADLFLSIHANSSPYPRIAGMETYYLNFASDKEAMDVAARENASSQKSIFELKDIIQKITLHDKAEESREFAGRVQSSLYALSAKNFPSVKNRGVKKAPFVVLVGANMPSILAEVGFVTNLREEALLKRPDYRQKLAEALFHGVSRYAESLSHFQVAQAEQ